MAGAKLIYYASWKTESHYCLIKKNSNLLHFLTRSKSKQNNGQKPRFCGNCFQPIVKKNFKSMYLFAKTMLFLKFKCLLSHTLEFLSWVKTQKCPLFVYADLEAINVATNSFSSANSRTREIEKQCRASFGAFLFDSRS